jgi:hypothetical protein
VSPLAPDDERAKKITLALREWRQGDVALGPKWISYIANGDAPLTAPAEAESGLHAATVEVDGVVLLTQTCDVVRDCTERHFVHVAPLKTVDDALASEVEKGLRPRFVRIPSLPRIVADLDTIATVEKSVVAEWDRTPGWTTDDELRAFADALTRKDSRFAFPDDFNRAVKRLQNRVREKHDKGTTEGAALRALREIRVTAAPSWDAAQVDIFMMFVRHDTPDDAKHKWDEWLEKWLELCVPHGRIATFEGRVTTLQGMTGKEYVESDRLDLDHLS